MKRKRGSGKRKPKMALPEEGLQNDAALVADYGLEDIVAEYAKMDDEVDQAETTASTPALAKSVANERTGDNVNEGNKTNLSLLGTPSKPAGSIANNQSRCNDDLQPRSETRDDTNMSDRQVEVQIEEVVNGKMGSYPNSLREMIMSIIKDMCKEAGGLTNLSRTLVDNPTGNEQMLQPHVDRTLEENTSLLHQDPEYKEQELKSALMVIKKTMKLDAARPFNVPVDPIALGIPDYFDVIDTPMDFGTICHNLENGIKYRNSADVYKDVQLIWDNCLKYNKKGGQILVLMNRVKASFMKYWMASGLHREPPAIAESSSLRCGKRGNDCPVTPLTENAVHLQQSKAGSTQVLHNQPSPVNIQDSQPQQSSILPQCSPKQNHANNVSTSQKKQKGRGPARCLKLLTTVGRISVATNELGQPIGPEASQLTSFLGLTARDGNLAPLTYRSWSRMPEENKENMWQKVLTKFDIDPSSRKWVLMSLGKRWRSFKSLLKATRFDIHETDEERLADRDERVLPDQWSVLCTQWKSEKWQNISAKNKATRAQQKFSHTSGKKSFAQVREEERAKRPDGKELSRAELFILTRTRKNGEPVNEEAAAVISQLRESAAQQDETSDKRSKAQEDAFNQIMAGASLHGLGPSSSRPGPGVPTRAEALQMVSEKNAEVLEMKEKLASVEQTCTQMAAQMAAMVSMIANMQKTSPGENVSNAVGGTVAPGGLLKQSEPTSTSHNVVPSRQTRGRKKRRT